MATSHAQDIEWQSFQMLNLSIQELLDCDTAVDQGCTGGNPLLAFYFIHRHGLTSWERYPYVGFEDTCRKKLIKYPVATVKSWGIIPPNRETHMELALRYIGPISVGFNGADPTFLSYDGGIFSKDHCKQGSNHALLLVGYGEEEGIDTDGNTTTTTRFWIARNSVSNLKRNLPTAL
jgi:Papain family cysteine protease